MPCPRFYFMASGHAYTLYPQQLATSMYHLRSTSLGPDIFLALDTNRKGVSHRSEPASMDEYSPYCAICGGTIKDPGVHIAKTHMGARLDSRWLSDAVLLHAEATELTNFTVLKIPAKHRGGPVFELPQDEGDITACNVSGSVVPSPRPLYIPCHAACMNIAEKLMTLCAEQPLISDGSTLPRRSVRGSKRHIWRVLKARFQQASKGKFRPVTNIGLINDDGGIWRYQGLAWEPVSEGVLKQESHVKLQIQGCLSRGRFHSSLRTYMNSPTAI